MGGQREKGGGGGTKGTFSPPSPAYFAPLHLGPTQTRGLCFGTRQKPGLWSVLLK